MIKQYFKSAKVSAITDLIGCINEMKCTELIVIYRSYSILGCLLMRSLFIELVKGNRFLEGEEENGDHLRLKWTFAQAHC